MWVEQSTHYLLFRKAMIEMTEEQITAHIIEKSEPLGTVVKHKFQNKRLLGIWIVFSVENNILDTIIKCQLYGNPETTIYACVWVLFGNETSGAGHARGSGYHKPSASIGMAIENAGFKLSQSIAGAGDDAIEKALVAVAHAVGAPGTLFVRHYD